MMPRRCGLKRVAFLVLAIICAWTGADAKENPKDAAKKVSREWLALIDTGKFAESWDTAGGYLHHACAKELWVKKLESTRKPLGEVRSRKMKSSTYHKPDHFFPEDRVRLEFSSQFANKSKANEVVTASQQKDGTWKIAGYYIN